MPGIVNLSSTKLLAVAKVKVRFTAKHHITDSPARLKEFVEREKG